MGSKRCHSRIRRARGRGKRRVRSGLLLIFVEHETILKRVEHRGYEVGEKADRDALSDEILLIDASRLVARVRLRDILDFEGRAPSRSRNPTGNRSLGTENGNTVIGSSPPPHWSSALAQAGSRAFKCSRPTSCP